MCFLYNFQKNKLMGLGRSHIQSFLSSSFERLLKNFKSSTLPCINFSTILNISSCVSKGTFKTTPCLSSPESCCSVAHFPFFFFFFFLAEVAQLLLISLITRRHMKQILMKSTKLYKKVYHSIHQLHFLEVQQ